ncbi:MAG: VanZ family protein [Phycisphaerales bacterium JB039]
MTELLSNRRVWRIALVVYAIALVTATHWPGARVNVIPGLRLDLLIHVGAYAALAGLLALAGVGAEWRAGRAVVLIILVASGWALIDEVTQAIPALRRTFDLEDLGADVAGAIVGATIGVALARRRPKADQQSSR